MKQGIFLTFEGNDGSGKTTVCKAVFDKLIEQGYDVIYTREPGGSHIAESIRDILLDVNNTNMDPRTEALLYAASRRQHLTDRVLPALERKAIVLCDRFVDSSLAYQGYARGLGMKEVMDINQFAIHGCMPQKTFFLSVSVETGKKRMDLRGDHNRLDLEESDFHKKVREGYENLLSMYPERITVIDAEPDLPVVVEKTMQEVMKVVRMYE